MTEPVAIKLPQLHLLPLKGRGATEEFKAYIAAGHYLGGTPPEGIVKLWAFLGERRIGALMFGRTGAREWAKLPILELTRCYFETDTPPNVESRALALSRKYIRTWMPHIRLVLAYSSTGEGHAGTIYQADGWAPLGRTRGRPRFASKRPRMDVDISDKLRWVRTP